MEDAAAYCSDEASPPETKTAAAPLPPWNKKRARISNFCLWKSCFEKTITDCLLVARNPFHHYTGRAKTLTHLPIFLLTPWYGVGVAVCNLNPSLCLVLKGEREATGPRADTYDEEEEEKEEFKLFNWHIHSPLKSIHLPSMCRRLAPPKYILAICLCRTARWKETNRPSWYTATAVVYVLPISVKKKWTRFITHILATNRQWRRRRLKKIEVKLLLT